jgi:undecaprenyl diphosphate synthase
LIIRLNQYFTMVSSALQDCPATESFLMNKTGSFSSFLATAFPLALGLFIGVWLGTTQSRQKKSLASIISSWFSSVFAITKFWIKFNVSKHSGSDSRNAVKKPVASVNSNGSSTSSSSTTELKKNYVDTPVESGIDPEFVPKHVAIIMDGNRRYGKRMYGKGSMGHFDGGQKALQVIEWMSTEGVKVLTLYAFSTENWNRESSEIDTLMGLFLQFVEDDLRPVVFNRKVRVKHICTDKDHIPVKLYNAIQALCDETAHHPEDSLTLNVCLSYGSRGEIMHACRSISKDVLAGKTKPDGITEDMISERMLTSHAVDPDVLIRTSGEERISNFLLWQLAYTELFFLNKDWPELEKEDFLKVIRTFGEGRQRRFGR